MDFKTFQPLCKYYGAAFAYSGDNTRMAPVCHKSNRIPSGHSWGICDKAHCPYFGIEIIGENFKAYDNDGKELAGCEKIKANIVLPPEDYE